MGMYGFTKNMVYGVYSLNNYCQPYTIEDVYYFIFVSGSAPPPLFLLLSTHIHIQTHAYIIYIYSCIAIK